MGVIGGIRGIRVIGGGYFKAIGPFVGIETPTNDPNDLPNDLKNDPNDPKMTLNYFFNSKGASISTLASLAILSLTREGIAIL